MYHKDELILNNLPNKDASTPKIVNVVAIPKENRIDNLNDFLISLLYLPTYPITKGMLDKQHGDKDVSIPATKANIGANHKFDVIV
jgi:hypothetical protein